VPFAAGISGYTDRWGLALPSHLIVFAAVLGLLLLSVLPTRAPAWIRSGVLPLALGGLLLGVGWSYVVGDVGSDVGSLAVAAAAVILVLAGTLGVRPPRHDRPSSGV
jgi:hypothetical protein